MRRLLGSLWLTPRHYFDRGAMMWAAALAYHSLLALIPVVIIAFSLLGVLQDTFDIDEGLERMLIDQGLPEAAAQVGGIIRDLVERVRHSSAGIGALGFAFLIWTAYTLFATLEAGCNALWEIKRRYRHLRSVRTFVIVMIAGPLLIGGSLFATARLQRYALEEEGEYLGPVLRYAVQAAPLILTCVNLYLLYRLVPAARVHRRSAVLGALVAGSFWEAAKWGFNLYVRSAHQIDALYGPLGILPLFIIWVQVTWVITLLGVQLSHVHQEYAQLALRARTQRMERRAVRREARARRRDRRARKKQAQAGP